MRIEEAVASAQRELLVLPGVVGISHDGRNLIVYVERPEISVPSSIMGYRVIKKVTGRVELL